MFADHVYIGTSDDIDNFDVIMSYREYFYNTNTFISCKTPSKLSSGFTYKYVPVNKDYFDNIYATRYYGVFLPNIILPKIFFLDNHGDYILNKNLKLLIYSEYFTTDKKIKIMNEAVMLIFPPKKIMPKYTGCQLIFKLDGQELKIDTTYFSYDLYTFIIYDQIDVEIVPNEDELQYLFRTTIKYNEHTIIEI